MPAHVKICGLSTPETVDAAIQHGATHIGFVFFAKSPRNIGPDQAAALVRRASGKAKTVGLFVDADPAFITRVRTETGLDIVQLHGQETPNFAQSLGGEVWKAIPVHTAADLDTANRYRGAASMILYDAKPPVGSKLPGGNGLRFDWELLRGHRHPLPWALSGGLDAENVNEAVQITNAPLVDVSSGVESAPGVKDVDKIVAFLTAVSR